LLLLLDGITALDDRSAERHPVEKIVVGFDLGGLSLNVLAGLGAGDVVQQE
jgi:hypothetical protein